MVKWLKLIKAPALLLDYITTFIEKPYYRFINPSYARIWTTVMSFTTNQHMMIFPAHIIIILRELSADPVKTNY